MTPEDAKVEEFFKDKANKIAEFLMPDGPPEDFEKFVESIKTILYVETLVEAGLTNTNINDFIESPEACDCDCSCEKEDGHDCCK